MGLFLATVLGLISLIITPGFLFYFDVTPKLVVLLAGTAAGLVWIAFSGARVTANPRGRSILSVLLLLNLISLAVSTVVSVRPGLSLFGANWRRYGSVIEAAVCVFSWVIAVCCAGRPDRVRTVLRGVTAAGAVSALYGIAQYLGWDPFLPAASYHVGEGVFTIVRPPGTSGYASYFATWLLFVIFLSLGLRALETSAAARCLTDLTAAMALTAMLLTGTRAAVLGLLAGGVAWLAVRRVRIPRRAVAALGLALLTGIGFYWSPPGRQIRSRVKWFTDDPWGGARLYLWRDSLRMASHRLAAGYGPEVFTAEFPHFESVELARAYPDFSHESPHNMFIDALVSQGLPGLGVLFALCAAAGLAAFRLKQPAFAGALAAGIVSQQFTAFTVPTAMMLFAVFGLLAACEGPPPEPRRWMPASVAAVLAAVFFLYCGIRLGAADHALAVVQDNLEAGDPASAAVQYGDYASLRLPGGSADLWYSRALLSLASGSLDPRVRREAADAAEQAAVRATETAEDPFNAWYNLAVVCGGREDGRCVDRSLRAAIRAHPHWFKPHWVLAQSLNLQGRTREARAEAALAAALNGGKDAEVTKTLDEMRASPATTQSEVLQR